jgi:hypothetical protein
MLRRLISSAMCLVRFVDVGTLGFRVTTSEAVDGEIDIDLWELDLDGLPRRVGPAVDVGVVERR